MKDSLRRKARRALAVLHKISPSCMAYLPPLAGTPYRRSKYLNSGKRSEPGQWLLEKYRSRGRAAVRMWLLIIITIIIMIIKKYIK
jgi:predicted nucleic acid-binding Zn ribbon protein